MRGRRILPAAIAGIVALSLIQVGLGGGRALSSTPDPDACLGIDADGDGAIDDLPSPESGCILVPFVVEPYKAQTVDLEFRTVHAAFLRTSEFDPAMIVDASLSFGDADDPENRATPPVLQRCKFAHANGDGVEDKVCKWWTPETGIQAGDTSACVTGRLADDRKIEACGPMTTLQEPSPSPSPSPSPTSTESPSPSPSPTSSETPSPSPSPSGSVPSISATGMRAPEGNGGPTPFLVSVTLSAAGVDPVSVDYTTGDAKANAGTDYEATSGTLTFTYPEVSKTITVFVIGDTVAEPNEDFFVVLSNPVNATIQTAQAQCIIRNDD